MKFKFLQSFIAITLCIMLAPAVAFSDWQDEPDWHHSGLVTYDGDVIWDTELSDMISNNIPTWQDGKFVFGQCYSGGFINDIIGMSYDNTVVSSSSDWDRPAHYDGTTGDSYMRWWNNAVNNDGTLPDQASMKEAYDYASGHPKVDLDFPQYASAPPELGDNLHLGEGITNKGVLFAGHVDDNPYSPINERQMFIDDLTSIHDSLINIYGYEENDIAVLFGDGTGPSWIDGAATQVNLDYYLNEIGTDMQPSPEDEQFFFWAFDHGTETEGPGKWLDLAWMPTPWDEDGWPGDDHRPVQPSNTLMLWAHVGGYLQDGELFHIDDISFHIDGGNASITKMIAEPSQWHQVSEWFPWAEVHIDDNPVCTNITFQADLRSAELGGITLWSNEVKAHVVPEPATMLLLGSGLAGLFGFGRKRLFKT